MNNSNMKNMVVLKDLPSNIVEEAIVVLKNNKKINKLKLNKKKEATVKTMQKEDKQYIIKEAEMLIANYIKEIETPIKTTKSQKNLQKKFERLKKINHALLFFSMLCFVAYLIK